MQHHALRIVTLSLLFLLALLPAACDMGPATTPTAAPEEEPAAAVVPTTEPEGEPATAQPAGGRRQGRRPAQDTALSAFLSLIHI